MINYADELTKLTHCYVAIHSNNLFQIQGIPALKRDSILEELKETSFIKHAMILNEDTIVGKIKDPESEFEFEGDGVIIHKQLNPKLWDKEQKLFPEVKEKIIEIVKHFNDAIEEDGIQLVVEDIWLLGSNANYNYTDESDLDIHIIADESFDCNKEHLQIIYNAYKTLFNKKYDIQIKGINAEIYVENKDKLSAVSSGVYSIKNDKWVKKPSKYEIPKIDQLALSNEINKWESEYEKIASNPSIEKIDKYIDSLYEVRKKSIADEGEFGVGNLVFKEIRRCGYLDNLKEIKTKLENEELSLKEHKLQESKEDIDNFIKKFGKNTYDKFLKLKDRLKNNGISIDFTYHIKRTDVDTLDTILNNAEARINKNDLTSKEIPGDYDYLGSGKGYDVYRINDYKSSIALGAGTGWCTAGRYRHYNDSSLPSKEAAIEHFNQYADRGIILFYFIGKEPLDKYAITFYPSNITETADTFIDRDTKFKFSNYEIFDAEDNIVSAALNKLPYQLVEQNVGTKLYEQILPVNPEGLVIDNTGGLVKVSRHALNRLTLPESIRKIYPTAFDFIETELIVFPNSIINIYENAIKKCYQLDAVYIPNSIKFIDLTAFDEESFPLIYSDSEVVHKFCEDLGRHCLAGDKFFKRYNMNL